MYFGIELKGNFTWYMGEFLLVHPKPYGTVTKLPSVFYTVYPEILVFL
jgi:hypothetical protein